METPEFDVDLFRNLHRDRAENVRWWQAVRCPCYDPERGLHNPNCPLCLGVSFVYTEQTLPGTSKANIRGVSEKMIFGSQGLLKTGDVYITTIPDEIPLGNGDYILLAQREIRESETIKRGATDEDPFRTYAVSRITQIIDLEKTYIEDTDYSLVNTDVRGTCYVKWLAGGDSPAEDDVYSVLFYHWPLYEVRNDVGEVRRTANGDALPIKVLGRLKNPDQRR